MGEPVPIASSSSTPWVEPDPLQESTAYEKASGGGPGGRARTQWRWGRGCVLARRLVGASPSLMEFLRQIVLTGRMGRQVLHGGHEGHVLPNALSCRYPLVCLSAREGAVGRGAGWQGTLPP